MELAKSAVTVINAGEYGRLIHDLYLRRELICLGEDVVNRAYECDVDEPATAQIEIAEQSLYDMATRGEYEGGFETFAVSMNNALQLAEAAQKRQGALSGVTTGLRDLDGRLGGLHASDLIILAGRPSMGKTALATNIAFNAAKAFRTERQEDGSTKVDRRRRRRFLLARDVGRAIGHAHPVRTDQGILGQDPPGHDRRGRN